MKFCRLFLLLILLMIHSGCIRFAGQAGYFKETPQERTEKTVGFDTAKAFEDQKARGSIAS